MLPSWPPDTVAILVTLNEGEPDGGERHAHPGEREAAREAHAIPVSALHRAGPNRLLIGLAQRRGSLRRLRAQPRVTIAVLAKGVAVTVGGVATVLEEALVDGVAAVEVQIDSISDHMQSAFEIDAGVRWRWIDADAGARDREVRQALARLADRNGEVDAR